MTVLMSVLVILGGGAWFTLALVPALRELMRPTDAAPLRVPYHAEDIRHFANGLRDFVRSELQSELEGRDEGAPPVAGLFHDGVPYLLLHGDGEIRMADRQDRQVSRSVVAAGTFRGGPDLLFTQPVFAVKDVRIEAGTVLRAAYAERDLELGEATTVLRFVHAGRHVRVGPFATIYGRLSSDQTARLDEGVYFERLAAPLIEFGTQRKEATHMAPLERAPYRPDSNGIELRAGRWLCRGRVAIPAAAEVTGDLVVRGSLEVGDDAVLHGSVKAHGPIQLGERVAVEGALVGAESVVTLAGCRIAGPVVAESTASLGAGSSVGVPGRAPATITAPRIVIAVGTVVAGAIWARDHGYVVNAGASRAEGPAGEWDGVGRAG